MATSKTGSIGFATRRLTRFACLFVVLFSLASAGVVQADYRAVSVTENLNVPWGMVWLPDGDLLVSDRGGKLYRIRDRQIVAEISGVPKVHTNGQGGLLDLEIHPDYATNQWLYFSYSDQKTWGLGSNTAVARAKLIGNRLEQIEVLYKGEPDTRRGQHYGSRIEFDHSGYLFFSIGDRGARDTNPQDPERDGGKVYRLHDDGRIPTNNPLLGTTKPAVYSWGHRNPQGMAVHPESGELWIHEHGPRGGDEINRLKPGANYGWPILSYGINYSGSTFAEGTERAGFESPLWYWDPSIAPSGMTFVTSERYPDWQGHLLVGSLKFGYLVLCKLEGDQVTEAIPVLEGIGRVRNVRQGPDGYIYAGIDGEGIKRIEPVTPD